MGPQESNTSPQTAATQPMGPAFALQVRRSTWVSMGHLVGWLLSQPLEGLGAHILYYLKTVQKSPITQVTAITSSDLQEGRECWVSAQDGITIDVIVEPLKPKEKLHALNSVTSSTSPTALRGDLLGGQRKNEDLTQ